MFGRGKKNEEEVKEEVIILDYVNVEFEGHYSIDKSVIFCGYRDVFGVNILINGKANVIIDSKKYEFIIPMARAIINEDFYKEEDMYKYIFERIEKGDSFMKEVKEKITERVVYEFSKLEEYELRKRFESLKKFNVKITIPVNRADFK